MSKRLIIILLLSLSLPTDLLAEPVLLTGEIASLEKQIVSAPRTDRWQIQIQWMHEEGTIANEGDLIAVFDSGSIKSQIKQSEERLAAEQLALKKKKIRKSPQ